MYRLIFILSLTIVALLIAAGCGDDDCPSCPTVIDTTTLTVNDTFMDTLNVTDTLPQEFLAWIDGYIRLDPYTEFEAYCFANGGANPFVDSFTIGDSVSNVDAEYYWHESDPYFYMAWSEESSAPYMYESGDLATVTVWGGDQSSTASVVILSDSDDEANILAPSVYDTLLYYPDTLEAAWTHIENAEWYGIELQIGLDSSGSSIYRYVYTYTYDTTYLIPDTLFGYAVRTVSFYALPTTGPDPEAMAGNWDGDFAAGKLYSYANYASAYVVFAEPPLTAKPVVTGGEIPLPDRAARDIIKAVYDAYK